MIVDFVTYCCPKDVHKLHAEGALEDLVTSHKYPFDTVYVVQQRCRGIACRPFDYPCAVLETEDYPDVRAEFGISEDDPSAESQFAGEKDKYYWKNHCLNPFIGLKVSDADFIVFADCDTVIRDATAGSWVEEGIRILRSHPQVIMSAPGHGTVVGNELGGQVGTTSIISQITFVCNRERFKKLDFNAPIEGEPGAFHYVFEGRVQRYCEHFGFFRAILPPRWGRVHHYEW